MEDLEEINDLEEIKKIMEKTPGLQEAFIKYHLIELYNSKEIMARSSAVIDFITNCSPKLPASQYLKMVLIILRSLRAMTSVIHATEKDDDKYIYKILADIINDILSRPVDDKKGE